MTSEPSHSSSSTNGAEGRRRRLLWSVGLVTMGIILGGLAGLALTPPTSPSAATPGDDSAEAGFGRDMQTHHAQAVQMSMMIRDRTNDPDIRSLAYDIALTQQHQIGQMYDWLIQWDLPQTSSREPMAWMSMSDHEVDDDATTTDDAADGTDSQTPAYEGTDETSGSLTGHSMGDTGDAHGTSPPRSGDAQPGAAQMPGMATAEDLERLSGLRGLAAERVFLQLMIEHHRGGIAMARAVLTTSNDPNVRLLAQTMVTGQTAEITAMEAMLAERAAPTER